MIVSSALPRMQCVIDVPNVDTFSQSVDPLQSTSDSPHIGEAFLGTLTKQGDDPNSSPWAVTVSLNGKPTQFEIDTGAEVSVILQKAHREIGSPKLAIPSAENPVRSEQLCIACQGSVHGQVAKRRSRGGTGVVRCRELA